MHGSSLNHDTHDSHSISPNLEPALRPQDSPVWADSSLEFHRNMESRPLQSEGQLPHSGPQSALKHNPPSEPESDDSGSSSDSFFRSESSSSHPRKPRNPTLAPELGSVNSPSQPGSTAYSTDSSFVSWRGREPASQRAFVFFEDEYGLHSAPEYVVLDATEYDLDRYWYQWTDPVDHKASGDDEAGKGKGSGRTIRSIRNLRIWFACKRRKGLDNEPEDKDK